MTGDLRRRAKAAFEEILDASPGERSSRIDAVCGDDTGLRSEVEALLAAEAAMGDFLEEPALVRLSFEMQGLPKFAPGDVVAGYTVTGVLGEGGGGIVYDALQEQPRRAVALKLVRSVGIPGSALRAFRDETESLARLRHPAIAHVYAAGTHEVDGVAVPWIAMERVEGARSITRFAREESLPSAARLRLFRDVCLAVHHAHMQGVIHRDVKPGNVLVDAAGRVKVVDFGIACGRDPAAGEPVPAGTVAYASPEQLAPGARIDTRADVYGLGALLHELLVGSPPNAEGESVSEDAAVAAGVPSDLRSILRRALARDREHRYDSAAALADDVARFLADEPVAAHPGGPVYAVAKFVRRRRAAAFALGAGAAALVAVTVVSTVSARTTSAALEAAERSRYVACVAAAAAALRADDAAEARRRLDAAPEEFRGWEWRHLDARTDVSERRIVVADDPVWQGAASEDGATIAAAHGDGRSVTVSIVRGDGTRAPAWTEPGARASVAVSRDGRRVASGFRDGSVRLRDLRTGAETGVPAVHASNVTDVEFSPDGTRLATAGADGGTALLDTGSGAVLVRFPQHRDRVIALAFTPCGGRLVAGCRDGAIRVLDPAKSAVEHEFSAHAGSVEGVAVSRDGGTIASVSRDRTLRLSSITDGRTTGLVAAHSAIVSGVAFSPTGEIVATASWDGTVRLWDTATCTERGVLRGHRGAVVSVGFAGGKGELCSFSWDGSARFWSERRIDTPTVRRLPDRVVSLALDGPARHVAAVCADGTVVVGSADDGRELWRGASPLRGAVTFADSDRGPARPEHTWARQWLSGGDVPASSPAWVLVRGWGMLPTAEPDSLRTYRVDEPPPVTVISRLDGDAAVEIGRAAGVARSFAYDAPSRSLALGMDDGGVVVWTDDGRSGPLTRNVSGGAVLRVRFEPGGRRIVASCSDATATVLSSPQLRPEFVLSGHSSAVLDAVFVPHDERIVTASRDGTARVWDARDGTHLLTLESDGYPFDCLVVSADGALVAAGAGSVEDPRSHVLLWSAPRR